MLAFCLVFCVTGIAFGVFLTVTEGDMYIIISSLLLNMFIF